MLTNHPDFHLARESLRFKAADYLLKSQLVAESLEASLKRACQERDKRTKLSNVELVDSYLAEGEKRALQSAALILASPPGSNVDLHETAAVLERHNITSGWGIAYIALDFSKAKGYENSSGDEKKRLFDWESDMLHTLADNLFPQNLLLYPDKYNRQLFLLSWGIAPSEWEPRILRFAAKAQTASATITQAEPHVMATRFFQSSEALQECQRQVSLLQQYYYLGASGVFFDEIPAVSFQPLGLSGLDGRLTSELRGKNPVAISKLLDRAARKVAEVPHEKNQAEWLCSEICSTVNTVMFAEGKLALCSYWENEPLLRREQVLQWLSLLKAELCTRLEQYASGKQELVEKAKQYVHDNVNKRIMLQDVADYVCISPGYLSALFKKMYNQNFVDYINHVKMERACELIREGRYRIYEISDMLSFENAYYFSQVFKHHIGVTPTGYQKQIRKE